MSTRNNNRKTKILIFILFKSRCEASFNVRDEKGRMIRQWQRSGIQRAIFAIVCGGLVAGILDIAYAIAVYAPRHPILIPQAIATGILGTKSYRMGIESAALGIVLHFTIALSATAVFYLVSLRAEVLTNRPLLSGMVYGACVYFFMHYVVLPLSAAPTYHHPLPETLCEFVEHLVFVGLPISLSVRNSLNSGRPREARDLSGFPNGAAR
ncbi:MAG: hypothetical protein WBY53_01050 [Acidobacteriaceae bacterium]